MKRVVFFLSLLVFTCAFGARIKDIAALKGARNNQLVGYGIVVGLPGTGDKANELTENSLSQVLKSLGVDLKTQKVDSKNAAAVVVSATLPPFSRSGAYLDASIAPVSTAVTLEGGTLLMTSLRGADGKIYAIAQGKIVGLKKDSKGGGGGGGNSAPPSWMVPNGATLEREIGWDFSTTKELRYNLNIPDFTTAVRVSRRINEELGGKYATPVDAGTVDVIFPYTFEGNPVELIAQIESVEVEADRKAKVVVNSRTGTVVLGEQVRIAPVAIAHNNLKIEVKEETRAPSADKNAGKTPDKQGAEGEGGAEGGAGGKNKKLILMEQGSNIAEIVSSLNDMGASSDDLVALVQALKSSGALMAEVEMQ